MKCIEIDHLHFKYDNKTIFTDLSLELHSNNCYVLAGLNGVLINLKNIVSGSQQ